MESKGDHAGGDPSMLGTDEQLELLRWRERLVFVRRVCSVPSCSRRPLTREAALNGDPEGGDATGAGVVSTLVSSVCSFQRGSSNESGSVVKVPKFKIKFRYTILIRRDIVT